MVPQDDWRRQGQERYLHGGKFRFKAYRAPSSDWDHDHCEFCFAKFSEQAFPDSLSEGWVTEVARWVCDPCFQDFKDEFEFVVSADSLD